MKDEFGPKLHLHLTNEINLLESLADDESINWSELGKAMAAESKKAADRVCPSILIRTTLFPPLFPPCHFHSEAIFTMTFILISYSYF